MALGLLSISRREFLNMRMIEVYWRLKAWKDDRVREQVMLRKQIFYYAIVMGAKVKKESQVFPIPEIDGTRQDEIEERKKHMSTITKLKPGEKPFTKLYGRSNQGRR